MRHATQLTSTKLKSLAFLIAFTAAVVIPTLSSPSVTHAICGTSCTYTDPWGTQEVAGSGWMGGLGVPIYSNGPLAPGGPSPDTYNYVNNKNNVSTQTGIEWQCVELASRLYITNGWITSTWLGNGDQLYGNAPSNLTKQAQGSITFVSPGDVIGMSKSGTPGHAAVISSVSGNSITIASQNTNVVFDSSFTLNSGSITMTGWSGYTIQGVIHHPGTTTGTDVSGTDSVSWASGRIDIFTRGSGGDLQHTFYTSSGGWSPTWESLGGGITGTPSAVSWQSGQLFVFVRGTDSHLYQRTYNSSTGWSAYVDLGGNIASGPAAVSWASGRIDIFARDSGGNLVHTFYTSSGGWSTWETLGSGIIDQPSAISWQSGRLDVFAEGADNHLYQMTYTTTGGWTAWTYIGGTLASGPGTVSWGVNRIDVFVRGTATDLDHTFYDTSGWSSSWESLGGGITGTPSAVSWQSGQLFAFMRGTDNHLYQRTYNSSTGWSGWVDLGVGPW